MRDGGRSPGSAAGSPAAGPLRSGGRAHSPGSWISLPVMDRPGASLRRVIAFGQELAGTLRRASVVDALLRHVRENLAPERDRALPLSSRRGRAATSLHVWPPRGPSRPAIAGARLPPGALWCCPTGWIPCSPTGLCRRSRNRGAAGCSRRWSPKSRVTGAIAVRGEPGRYGPADLALLEGLVSQASIALESARLVDLHDDGRRSWQEVVDAISPAHLHRGSGRAGSGGPIGPSPTWSTPRPPA